MKSPRIVTLLLLSLSLWLVQGCSGDDPVAPQENEGGEETEGEDLDSDGLRDDEDNCPEVENAEQLDLDEDGLGDLCDDDADGDGVTVEPDCDDLNAQVGEAIEYFEDADLDGLGDPESTSLLCERIDGYVDNDGDLEPACATNDTDDCGVCAGGNAALDCNDECFGGAVIDECDVCGGTGQATWYVDTDEDGLGSPEDTVEACEAPEGYVANGDDLEPDCTTNDTDACGICAGPGTTTYYEDQDLDGLGDPASTSDECELLEGWVENADDLEPDCITNDTDDCGVCAGANADMDCFGTCLGEAAIDLCGVCAGGESGLVAELVDTDEDGVGDSCDGCPATPGEPADRFVVQYTEQNHYDMTGGPYTFQVVLYPSGDFSFHYNSITPFGATPTIGHQGDAGADAVQLGYNDEFAVDHPTVFFRAGEDGLTEPDYDEPVEWIDVVGAGEDIDLEDDDLAGMNIGFDFPFHGETYSRITIGSNGFLMFGPPFPGDNLGAGNVRLPAADVGSLIAPFWDDLNPDSGGTITGHYMAASCEEDCGGLLGGPAFTDECGACVAGTSGVSAGTTIDCYGTCFGTAFVDDCQTCVGGETGLEPVAEEDCPVGPDLIVLEDDLASDVSIDTLWVPADSCLPADGCVTGTGERRILLFDTSIANIGNEDLYVGQTNSSPYYRPSECSGELQFQAYAKYELFEAGTLNLVAEGRKTGFCVMDIGLYDTDLTDDGGCEGYNCWTQGISAGCFDTYESYLECQWIDITDLGDGTYDLFVTTNPEGELPELDYTNNSGSVRVEISGDSVSVIDDD